VPLFEAPHFDDYQRLGRARLGSRADRALEEAVAEVGRITGARTDRVFLFGYSGGAQFVHRFVMAHPDRVASAAVSSAGWYTFPNAGLPYPLGIGSTTGLPGVGFDPEAFLRVPILVTVGARDTERAASLRQSDEVDHQQGQTRAERARRWVVAMQEAARSRNISAAIELRELPGADHSFSGNMERARLGEIVFEHLFDSTGDSTVDSTGARASGIRAPSKDTVARPVAG
jgi:poly(3-hydroxybutyrate) depolymerase